MSVFDLKKGGCGVITDVKIDGAAAERLRSLGVERGKKIYLLAFSLFKSSVLILIGYTRVAIRKSVAQRIEVQSV